MTDTLIDRLQDALGNAFTIRRELGGGGMSRVFLARDNALERDVVVKLLSPDLAVGLSADRFGREIRLVAALQQANIVPLLSAGTLDTLPYYTMPFVDGLSLRSRLSRNGALPVTDCISIMRDVARALAYAHEHGVVHRDIKPDNILLSGEAAVVTDFGIAKAVAASRAGGATDASGTLTSVGTSIGTPSYMAPEQAAGDPGTDHRADLYALGCVVYEMLAGASPFGERPPHQLLIAHLNETPTAIETRRTDCPPALAQLLARCLEKDPARRPQTAREILATLDGVSSGAVSGSGPSATPRRGSHVALAAAVAAMVGAGGWFMASRSTADAANAADTNAAVVAADGIAVLPFDNLGDSTDAYFADGITDAVRGELTRQAEVPVIARTSSEGYRNGSKPLVDIARELGVRYLLTGTVRWARNADGSPARVLVSPELVEITANGQTQSRWQERFDAEVKDVFRVQGDIADRAVAGMRGALASIDSDARRTVNVVDPAAYDLYLRGVAAVNGGTNLTPAAARQAISYFKQAIARDSSVAEWWGWLSRVSTVAYMTGTSDPQLSEQALRAAERSKALAPNRAFGHQALAVYHRNVRSDIKRGLVEYERAVQLSPNDVALLSGLATSLRALGQQDSALTVLQRAVRLDPQSSLLQSGLANSYLAAGRLDEAERRIERVVSLELASPNAHASLMQFRLARGDLAGARAAYTDGIRHVPINTLTAFVAVQTNLGWMLDDNARRLAISLGPEAYDNNPMEMAQVRSELSYLLGDTLSGHRWRDSTLVYLRPQLRAAPDDWQLLATHAIALARRGRRADAFRELDRALASVAGSPQRMIVLHHARARTAAMLGEPAVVRNALQQTFARPSLLTPAMVRLDPVFAPLRGNPQFEQVLAEGERMQRANVKSTAPAPTR